MAHVLRVGDLVVAKFPAYRGLAPEDANPYFAATVERAVNAAGDRCALTYADGDYSDDVKPDEIFYAPGRPAEWGKGELRGNDMLPDGAQPVKLPLSEAQLVKQFAIFDTDGSGQLTEAEVLAILTRPANGKQPALSEQEARQLIGSMLTQFDENGDGVLSIDEYARATTVHPFVAPLCQARTLPAKPEREPHGDEPIPEAELSAIQGALDAVSARYGLTFRWNVPPPGNITGRPCSQRLLSVFASVFLDELTLYPPSLFLKGEEADGGYDWVRTVYLCEHVSTNGGKSEVGGCAGGQNLIVNASSISGDGVPSEFEVANFKQIFHHELFHLIDVCLQHHKQPFYAEWDDLNPPGFAYSNYGEDSMNLAPHSGPPGFVCAYATAHRMEDKAMVFAMLFSTPKYMADMCEKDAIVAAKVAMLKAQLHEYCADVSEQVFWNQHAMLEYAEQRATWSKY